MRNASFSLLADCLEEARLDIKRKLRQFLGYQHSVETKSSTTPSNPADRIDNLQISGKKIQALPRVKVEELQSHSQIQQGPIGSLYICSW